MLSRTFVYETDGWRDPDAPDNFDSVNGRLAMHDIMEHGRNDRGTLEEELMALGAIMYIRYEGGILGGGYGDVVSNDVIFQLASYDQLYVRSPGKTKPLSPYLEIELEELVRRSTQLFATEFKYSQEAIPDAFDLNDWLLKAVGWIRRGYRKSVRRYRNMHSSMLASIFEQGMRDIDNLRHVDYMDRLTVIVDLKRYEVRLRLNGKRV